MKKTTPSRKTTKKSRSYERTADQPIAITPLEYGGLQEAYDFFNVILFDGALPDVFITYQRRANSAGYFAPDRFSGRIEKFGRHELALNPDTFIAHSDEWICQTLVHEMTHGWQQHCGTPPARGYHNREWANKMKAIGLQPSSTGAVGGKETGARMSDYVIPDGPFTKAFAKLAATGWKLNLQSAHRPGPKGGSTGKDPFRCPACGQKAWGKPKLDVTCTPCVRGVLEAAGIDPAVIEPARMKSAKVDEASPLHDETTPNSNLSSVAVAESESYEPAIAAEPAKPKRGRPKGSTEALSRLETHRRKKS
jgi:hypothetical protein